MSTAVRYALSDFVTGGPLLDVPINEGASWATVLNKADSLSCSVDLRNPDAQVLDITNAASPKKAVLSAITEDGTVLAWGVGSEHEWSEDDNDLGLAASGFWQYLNENSIAPAAARTSALVLPDGSVNPALDTLVNDLSLGTVGKRLVQQILSWPGAPAMTFQADEVVHGRTAPYTFASFKKIGSALTDLVNRIGGPDFAFDAAIAANGLDLAYSMRFGTNAKPLLGEWKGSWTVGGDDSPIRGLKVKVIGDDISTSSWMTGGKQGSKVIMSRKLNDAMIADGYAPRMFVDTTHSDVVLQGTLDDYNDDNLDYASGPIMEISFEVRGNAPGLSLGQYRAGDWVDLDVLRSRRLPIGVLPCRITGISGNETGEWIKVSVVAEGPTV